MSLRLELLKWLETARVAWSNLLAYRFDFFLRMVGPSIVFFAIKYNLWSSIFTSNAKAEIGGYSLASMLEYQVWVFFVNLLAQSYASHNMSVDIRLGKISTYLIYPFDFWQFHTASFLGFFALQSLITAVSVVVFQVVGLLPHFDLVFFSMGMLFTFFVAVFWYASQFVVGVLGFWLEETWVIRVIFIMMANLFSGSILPIELYPHWFRAILFYTPFPYITYVPAKIFMGQYSEAWWGLGVLSLWIAAVVMLCTVLWRKGLKLYSGAGM